MMHQLRARWKHLAPRERTMLMIGGVITAVSLLFILLVDPLLSTLDRLDRQAGKKQKESSELALLAQEYTVNHARLVKAESRMPAADSGFSLLAFLGVPGRRGAEPASPPRGSGGMLAAAHPLGGYALAGCTVGPGFDFEDFFLLARDPELASRVRRSRPELAAWI